LSWPNFDENLVDEKSEEFGNTAIDYIDAVRKYKTDKKVSLAKEIELEINSEFKDKIEHVIDDLKAVVKAKTIAFGKDKIKLKSN